MVRLRESNVMKITVVILLLIFILMIPVCIFAEKKDVLRYFRNKFEFKCGV